MLLVHVTLTNPRFPSLQVMTVGDRLEKRLTRKGL